MGAYFEIIRNRRTGPLAALARGLLRAASWAYELVIRARLGLYALRVLRRGRAPLAVICVGNLTTGGTGKTPCVAWLANVLVSRGRKPCVLSRGYRSREGGNDEARVLAELCPGVTLREDPDRLRGARACAEAGADVVVLDDGFSHLRLARDLDIVLIDALDPFGGGYLLPRGLLREPLSGLRRAGAVIVTRADLATEQRLRELDDVIKCHGMTGPIAHARHEPLALVPLEGGQAREPGWLAGRTVAAFCGIGNPAGFAATLEALGARLARPMFALEDHAAYDPRQLAALNAHLDTSRQAGAELAICTQKDAVKLRGRLAEPALPVFELRVGFRVTRDEQALLGLIERALEGR